MAFFVIQESLLLLLRSNQNFFEVPTVKVRMYRYPYFLFDIVTDISNI
ncbi:hypothetical protein [Enterococcus villorum]